MLLRTMIINAVILSLFAIVGTYLVSKTYDSTKQQISANQRQTLLDNLNNLIPAEQYNNVIDTDFIEITDPLLGNSQPHKIYRARNQNKNVAIIAETTAPDGYGGAIELLVAIYANGTVAGVRVLQHHETPGLGDKIELRRSPWILGFSGRSLQHPDSQGWQVKKDGGNFDQFTGATITPRAVVKAVYQTLQLFQQQRNHLFAPAIVTNAPLPPTRG